MPADRPNGDAVAHFSAYAAKFDAYYRDREEFTERMQLWSGLLDRYVVPGGSSIDLGCGTGVFSFYLAGKSGTVAAVDGAPGMIEFCEEQARKLGVTNVRFSVGRLPAIDETGLANADLVISSSVVEYVPDLDATLALFSRLLKPGAALILSMPNRSSVSRTYERLKYKLTGQPEIYQHILHFTSPRALEDRVKPFGLALQEAHYYTHYTRAAKLARAVGLPPPLTEDLFVAVFRKGGS